MSDARAVLVSEAPTRRRLALFFGVRYATPVVALIALATSPSVEIDRGDFAAILSVHVVLAGLVHLLGVRRPRALAVAIWAGILMDVGLVSLLAAMSGGPGSPMTFLLTLEAMTAGILLSSASGLRVIVLATGAIVALEVARTQGLIGDRDALPHGLAAIGALWVLGGASTIFSAFNERELKRRNAELTMINRIALDVENTLSLHTVLQHLARGVVEGLGFDAAAVLIAQDGGLRCVSAYGATGPARQPIEIRGAVAEALDTGKPRIVNRDEARRDPVLAELIGGRGYLAVPLSSNGVLVVTRSGRKNRPGTVRGHEIEALRRLAHHGAVALANARLHEHVSAMAVTDPLTGLANHGEFQRRLEEELGRLARYASLRAPGHRLSLLLMDVDHFKKFNDTLGHQAGDAILREIADALRRSVRSFDVVTRYGGDEFAVILPETDADGAKAVAQRILTSIAEGSFPVPRRSGSTGRSRGKSAPRNGKRPLPAIGVSIGVATAPENGLVPATLVAAADQALYSSKERGRGRLSHAADARTTGAKVVPLNSVKRRRQAPGAAPSRAASRPARERSYRPKRRTPRA